VLSTHFVSNLEFKNNELLANSTCIIEGLFTLDHVITLSEVTSPLATPSVIVKLGVEFSSL
jgi:hypothetical protein